MKLTKKVIDRLGYIGPAPRRHVEWDDEIKGFGVRIYPTGRKAFILSFRTKGRKRLMTIGDYGLYTVDQARDLARKHVVDNKDGDDPLDKKQRALRGESIKDLCEYYIDRYAKDRKKTWEGDQQYLNKHVVPIWGSWKANSLKRSDVAALHRKIGKKHPYAANRVVEIISKMYSLAQLWGLIENGVDNPTRGIDHFKEVKRDRWITPAELPHVAAAIDQDENLYARHAFWLYLLTGLRKTELLTAKWEYIDWDRNEICIPETKSGKKHYLPLSEAALTLLQKIPHTEKNPYILPGTKEGQNLVNIDKAWRRVRNRATVKFWAAHADESVAQLVAELTKQLQREPTCKEVREKATFELPNGVEDVRLHDLRRTVGSWMAQSGNSLHLIGRVLNHSEQKTTAVYARFGEDHVRKALNDHGKQILGIAGKTPKAKVVRIGKQ